MREKFIKAISKLAEILDSNLILDTIKKVFTYYMPFIIVGSFANLFSTLLSNDSIKNIAWLKNLCAAFDAIYFATMTTMTLIIVVMIGLIYGKAKKVPEYISGAVAFVSFLSIMPNSFKVTIKNSSKIVSGSLSSSTMNSQSLFVGMIVAFVSVTLFARLMKCERIKIKMPNSVPEFLATSFNTLIPVCLTVFIIAIAGAIFKFITGSYVGDWIYLIIQMPLQHVLQSPWGVILVAFIVSALWLFGVHGWMAVSAITKPLMLAALADNIAEVNAGGIASNPVTQGFWGAFCRVGGNGMIFCLVMALLIASKRTDHRKMAKMGLIPTIFYISEPMMFGLPVVLNPIFAVPFILAPMAGSAIGMVAMKLGFITPNIVNSPVDIVGLYPLLTYGTLNAFIVHIIVIAIGIYPSFLLTTDRHNKKQI